MSASVLTCRRVLAIGAVAATAIFHGAGFCEPANSASAADIERGEKVFRHVWEPGDLVAVQGDGLGPLYNERSCIACHFLGGSGGAGPNQQNVDILTAAPPKDAASLQHLEAQLRAIHPGFGRGSSMVLHRFSTQPDYAPLRNRLVGVRIGDTDHMSQGMAVAIQRSGKSKTKKQADNPIKTIHSRHGVTLFLSQRNTTPLFGAGLIDRISDREITEAASAEALEDPDITGRFVGRFGWRGQVADLRSFVLGACAVEVGLEVPGHRQTKDPLRFETNAPGPDMSEEYCADLIAYVASLRPPRRPQAENRQQAVDIQYGEASFQAIGCATCHHPQLGSVQGLYSDLLLHDMGPRLEDPASAGTFASAEYYGPAPDLTSPFAAERRREWKTPPLWGLRDSRPYLHDGRAATIEEAIAWHGGEAAKSLALYQALPADHRAYIALFLSSLRAPVN